MRLRLALAVLLACAAWACGTDTYDCHVLCLDSTGHLQSGDTVEVTAENLAQARQVCIRETQAQSAAHCTPGTTVADCSCQRAP